MNIAIVGYGKMGRKIEEIAKKNNHQVNLIIDKNNSDQYFNSSLGDIDVIIEFSTPETAFDNIFHGLRVGVPVVSGTTGWLDQWSKIEQFLSENNGAFLYASNFSIGMNLFFQINEFASRLMNKWHEFELSIEETHHTQKIDKPSGTAISLAEQIIKQHGKFDDWVSDPEEKTGQLPIYSFRVSDNPGTHKLRYESLSDNIILQHQAKNRDGFAKGALLAADWLRGKNGVFSMKNVILDM